MTQTPPTSSPTSAPHQDASLDSQHGVTELLITSPTRCLTSGPYQGAHVPVPVFKSSATPMPSPTSAPSQGVDLSFQLGVMELIITSPSQDAKVNIPVTVTGHVQMPHAQCSCSVFHYISISLVPSGAVDLLSSSISTDDAGKVFEVMPHAYYAFSWDNCKSLDPDYSCNVDMGTNILNISITNHRQASKMPKPPWMLGTEVCRSRSGKMQLISGFLLEMSPWCRDCTLLTQWQPSMPLPVQLKQSSSWYAVSKCMVRISWDYLKHWFELVARVIVDVCHRREPAGLSELKHTCFTFNIYKLANWVLSVKCRENGAILQHMKISWSPPGLFRTLGLCSYKKENWKLVESVFVTSSPEAQIASRGVPQGLIILHKSMDYASFHFGLNNTDTLNGLYALLLNVATNSEVVGISTPSRNYLLCNQFYSAAPTTKPVELQVMVSVLRNIHVQQQQNFSDRHLTSNFSEKYPCTLPWSPGGDHSCTAKPRLKEGSISHTQVPWDPGDHHVLSLPQSQPRPWLSPCVIFCWMICKIIDQVLVARDTSLHLLWNFTTVHQHNSVFMLGIWRLLHQLTMEEGVKMILDWFCGTLNANWSTLIIYKVQKWLRAELAGLYWDFRSVFLQDICLVRHMTNYRSQKLQISYLNLVLHYNPHEAENMKWHYKSVVVRVMLKTWSNMELGAPWDSSSSELLEILLQRLGDKPCFKEGSMSVVYMICCLLGQAMRTGLEYGGLFRPKEKATRP